MSENLPDIYLYNSTCEMAIANGLHSYQAPKFLRKFEQDLDVLPLFFANEQDYILVEELPKEDFLRNIENAGFTTPNFIEHTQTFSEDFIELPKGYLKPWGWSPATHHYLNPLKENCCVTFKALPNFNWQAAHKQIYSRLQALVILKSMLSNSSENWLLSYDEVPIVCKSIEEVQAVISKKGNYVIKSPWSSSGRGLQLVSNSILIRTTLQWLSGILKNQGYVMVEKWLDKIIDVSFHFFINNKGEAIFKGNATFFTNAKGKYVGNNLGTNFYNIAKEHKEFLDENVIKVAQLLKKHIEKSDLAKNYYGYIGVDTILYKDHNQLKFHPCIEINTRYNMGTLTLELNKHIYPEKEGMWTTEKFKNKGDFKEFCKEKSKDHPVIIENCMIVKGFLSLSEPKFNSDFGAYLLIE